MKYNKTETGTTVIFLVLMTSGCVITNGVVTPDPVIAQQKEQHDSEIIIKDRGSFVDADGILNVVGVVDNKWVVPVSVTMGLNVTEEKTKNKQYALASDSSSFPSPTSLTSIDSTSISTMTEPLYGKVIHPDAGAPFRFKVEPGNHVMNQPFVKEIRELPVPSYTDILILNYSNIAVGSEKALVGTIKNNGPFEVNNVYVYASVHDSNKTQIDSAKSPIIPVIQPGKEVPFKLKPDPAVKSQAYYYSCAGLDYDSPITTLATGNGGFIPFTLEALAKVTEIRYENTSNSIIFGVDHYNPDGGMITLKLPQVNQNEMPNVLLDELAYGGDDAKITSDGKTIYIDIFVPPEEHQVQIKGISSMT